ncbi:hypothetical protein AB205_0100350, partial [Aquarana catesbeiana]
MAEQGIAEYCGVFRGMAEYWGVLQSIAGYCRVWQSIAGYCRVLQGMAENCRVLQSIVGHCRVLRGYCRVLQGIAGYCRVLQGIAEYCGALQSIAQHCRTLQSSEGWLSMDGWMAGCHCAALWALQMQPTALLPSIHPPLRSQCTDQYTGGEERNRRHHMTPVCLHVIVPSFDGAIT